MPLILSKAFCCILHFDFILCNHVFNGCAYVNSINTIIYFIEFFGSFKHEILAPIDADKYSRKIITVKEWSSKVKKIVFVLLMNLYIYRL